MTNLNWRASIEPGMKMLGLSLGMDFRIVQEMLRSCSISHSEIAFDESPRLNVDDSKDGLIVLRVADMKNVVYAWENIVVRLIFDEDILKSIVVLNPSNDEEFSYKGKIFNKIGLGSLVSDLLDFGFFEYDEVDEVFFSDEIRGLEIGGSGICDLSVDSSQIITFIRIF